MTDDRASLDWVEARIKAEERMHPAPRSRRTAMMLCLIIAVVVFALVVYALAFRGVGW